MLTFIIPLKSKQASTDWSEVTRLYARMLQSVANQTSPAWRALIVGHEQPDVGPLPPECEFITSPFPPPDLQADSYEERLGLMRNDKKRKLLLGIQHLPDGEDSYAMPLDADDLVSCRLAGFVAEHAGENGWYFDRGYRFEEKCPKVLFAKRIHHKECGSSHILRNDLIKALPVTHANDGDQASTLIVERHAHLADALARMGTALRPLPFPGSVYSFNVENIYATKLRKKDRLRTIARWMLKARPRTARLRNEFWGSVSPSNSE